MIRRHRHQQQARFGDPYYCGPRGTTGTGGLSSNSTSYTYTRRTELTRASGRTYFS